jgi:predicted nuclease of predicted toxin-antitoxin system
LRFLADESCDFAIVRLLRGAGHDVSAIAETHPGITDQEVIALARTEKRIVITEDKGFGQLVKASDPGSGVILLRFHANARTALADMVVKVVTEKGDDLQKAFTVVRPGKVRILRR